MAVNVTTTIWKIAVAPAESSLPLLPNAGGHVTWSSPWTVTVGGQNDDTDDAYLSKEKITFKFTRDELELKPPLSQSRVATFIQSERIDEFEFTTDSMNAATLMLDNTFAQSTQTITSANNAEPTYKAVAVEFRGSGVLYFPKCAILVNQIQSGAADLAQVEVRVIPHGTSSVPNGWQYVEFATA